MRTTVPAIIPRAEAGLGHDFVTKIGTSMGREYTFLRSGIRIFLLGFFCLGGKPPPVTPKGPPPPFLPLPPFFYIGILSEQRKRWMRKFRKRDGLHRTPAIFLHYHKCFIDPLVTFLAWWSHGKLPSAPCPLLCHLVIGLNCQVPIFLRPPQLVSSCFCKHRSDLSRSSGKGYRVLENRGGGLGFLPPRLSPPTFGFWR